MALVLAHHKLDLCVCSPCDIFGVINLSLIPRRVVDLERNNIDHLDVVFFFAEPNLGGRVADVQLVVTEAQCELNSRYIIISPIL